LGRAVGSSLTGVMNRRSLIFSSAAALATAARAEESRYAVSLVSGGLGLAGVRISLAPQWKTYWRMPGDSGIPPRFDWSGSVNLMKAEVLYPVPTRFRDASGETIGYHDEIVFPVAIEAENKAQTSILKLNLAFAVCRDICIPAMADPILDLSVASTSPLVGKWKARVPVVLENGPVRKASARMANGKLMLELDVENAPNDVFIEADSSAYFGKPVAEGGKLVLPVSNIKSPDDLRDLTLRATLDFGVSAIEQTIKVA
jgi:DsbC/DsbD-like thiol-disulfide interchange protein